MLLLQLVADSGLCWRVLSLQWGYSQPFLPPAPSGPLRGARALSMHDGPLETNLGVTACPRGLLNGQSVEGTCAL